MNVSRRRFLGDAGKTVTIMTAASAIAPSLLAAESPNETIGVGCIGIGTRGGDLLNAVKAGKDIYCEKGLARTLTEAKLMRDALRQSKVVFQLGHQGRQSTAALQAKELIAQGVLGPVTLVRTGRFMSSDPAHPMWRWYGYYGQWNRPDPAQVVKDVPCREIPWHRGWDG